jgi:hypothetical protein
MKYFLILLFAMPLWSSAQINSNKHEPLQSYKTVVYCDTCISAKVVNDTLFLKGRRDLTKDDTVKVIMLMTDTSENNGTTLNGNGIVFWQMGYEIRRGFYICCDPKEKSGSYYWSYSHLAYINGDKKELGKSIIVWESKQLQ